jgi:ribosomal protein S18 acetylase RimI-like enzyme
MDEESDIEQFENADIVKLLNTDNFKLKYLYFNKINEQGKLVTRTNYFYIFKKDIVLINPSPDFDFDLNDNNIAYQLSSPEDEKTIISSFENTPGYQLGNNHDYVAKYSAGWLWSNQFNSAIGSFLLVKPQYRRQGWGTYLYMLNASLAFDNSVLDIEAMNASGNWTLYKRLGMRHNPREDDDMWGKTSILAGATSLRLFCRNFVRQNPNNYNNLNGICDNTCYRTARLKSHYGITKKSMRTKSTKSGHFAAMARAAALMKKERGNIRIVQVKGGGKKTRKKKKKAKRRPTRHK